MRLRLARLRRDDLHHRPNDFPRREKLAAMIALLAHLEEQAFIDFGERKDVRRVHRRRADFMNPVQHVEEVAFGVDTRAVHAGHDFTHCRLFCLRVHGSNRKSLPSSRRRLAMKDSAATRQSCGRPELAGERIDANRLSEAPTAPKRCATASGP